MNGQKRNQLQGIISEVESSPERVGELLNEILKQGNRDRLKNEIDKALDERNEETFFALTNEYLKLTQSN